MKSSLIVISALFASVSAIKLADEDINLQIGVEARARSNVREELRSNLRAFLAQEESKPANSQNIQTTDYHGYQGEGEIDMHGYGQWGNTGHKHVGGDSNWPAPILPGSEPVMPVKSSDPDVFTEPEPKKKTEEKPKDTAFLQLSEGDDDMPTVSEARQQAAQMQAQMDQAIAEADEKRAQQQAQYDNNIQNDDPAGQLQGLMNAQASLHRLTSAFSAKPNLDKVTGMAQRLGIPMTPELMQLGTNEAISNALVEIAVGMGKSETEIGNALGGE